MVHPLCCIHNRLQPLADAQAAVVVVVQAVGVDAEQVAVVVVVQAAAGGLLVQLQLVVYTTDKCGSTTAYIVLHNSMDYYMLDIDSFIFLLPLKKGNPLWAIGKRCTGIYICSLKAVAK